MNSKIIREKLNKNKKKMKNELNKLKNENKGQGAAEYILLIGGIIVIAVSALLIYQSYFNSSEAGLNATNDIQSVRANVSK